MIHEKYIKTIKEWHVLALSEAKTGKKLKTKRKRYLRKLSIVENILWPKNTHAPTGVLSAKISGWARTTTKHFLSDLCKFFFIGRPRQSAYWNVGAYCKNCWCWWCIDDDDDDDGGVVWWKGIDGGGLGTLLFHNGLFVADSMRQAENMDPRHSWVWIVSTQFDDVDDDERLRYEL